MGEVVTELSLIRSGRAPSLPAGTDRWGQTPVGGCAYSAYRPGPPTVRRRRTV